MASRFAKLRELLTPTPDASDEAIQGRAEAVGQGAFGLGDEIGAGLQAAAGGLKSYDSPQAQKADVEGIYKQARGENRDVLRREHEREPVRAAGLEIAAGAPLMLAGGPAKAAGMAAKDLGFASTLTSAPVRMGVKEAMKAALPSGLASGFGHSNAKDTEGQVEDTLIGGGGAALLSGGLRAGANAALKAPFIKQLVQKLQKQAITRRTGGLHFDSELDAPPTEPGAQAKWDELMAIGKRQLQRSRSAQNSGNKTIPARLRAMLEETE